MKKKTFSFLLILAWAVSGPVSAADYECRDLIWGDWTVDHPDVASACDSVVTRNGTLYAKFNTEFEREFNDGSVKLRLIKPDGGFVVDTFRPPEGFKISLPETGTPATVGGETPFARTPPGESPFGKLPSGAKLRLYVPEGVGFSVPVVEAVVVEEVEEVEPYVAPEPAPMTLPTTASHLPLLGLLGGFFVLLGGLLAAVRRQI
jgi:hypothetical protein